MSVVTTGKHSFFLLFVSLWVMTSAAFAADLESLKLLTRDEARISKDIPADRNIDAVTAYRMSNSQKVTIVDVRTVQEYQFVGHVPTAYSVPAFTWGKWDEQKKLFNTDPNPDFVKQFSALFPDKAAPVIIMCRSGHRSGKAVKLLVEAGYTNVYQMWEGFEGIPNKEKDLPAYGMKNIDGWRNKNLPSTWDMDPQRIAVK